MSVYEPDPKVEPLTRKELRLRRQANLEQGIVEPEPQIEKIPDPLAPSPYDLDLDELDFDQPPTELMSLSDIQGYAPKDAHQRARDEAQQDPSFDHVSVEDTQDQRSLVEHVKAARSHTDAFAQYEITPERYPDSPPSRLPEEPAEPSDAPTADAGIPQEVLDEITNHAHGTHPTWTPDEAAEPEVSSVAYQAAQRMQQDDDAADLRKPPNRYRSIVAWARRNGKNTEARRSSHIVPGDRVVPYQKPENPSYEQKTISWSGKNVADDEQGRGLKNAEYPASHSARPSEFVFEARNHADRADNPPPRAGFVRDTGRTVSIATFAATLLYVAAILLAALAVYGATGIFYDINRGLNYSRDFVYVIAPAAIAIVMAFSGFMVTRARFEYDYYHSL